MHPPFLLEGGLFEPPNKFSQSSGWGKGRGGGGLTGSQFLERGCCERGGRLFPGEWGCSFYVKNKLKSEIFNDEKSL